MAMGLILEFEGVGRETYEAVNRNMDIDTTRPTGNWPPGLKFHAGGAKPGGWVVFEIWETQEAQDQFMRERLGAALARSGVTKPPSRVEWLTLAAYAMQQSAT